jgi:hypothetical protein
MPFFARLRALFRRSAAPVSEAEATEILTLALIEQQDAGFDTMGPVGKVHLWIRGGKEAASLLPRILERAGEVRRLITYDGAPDAPEDGTPNGDALLSLSWPERQSDGRIRFEVGWTLAADNAFANFYFAEHTESGWRVRAGALAWAT